MRSFLTVMTSMMLISCGDRSTPGQTCEQAGGKCGALTASGVSCAAGYSANDNAGTCAVGSGCCMPQTAKTCEQAGGKCGALTTSGVTCESGYVANSSAGTCAVGGSCCIPQTAKTCEQAGGKCGALTTSGVTCESGYVANSSAGTCAAGSGCCTPKTCEQAGGKCGALTASGVTCESGYTANLLAGVCTTGNGCCVPKQKLVACSSDTCTDPAFQCYSVSSDYYHRCTCSNGKLSCESVDVEDGKDCAELPEGIHLITTCKCSKSFYCDCGCTCTDGAWKCTLSGMRDAAVLSDAAVKPDAGI
jgi:hypothetical protein